MGGPQGLIRLLVTLLCPRARVCTESLIRGRVCGTVKDLRPLTDPAPGMATTVSLILPHHFKLRVQPDPSAGQITVGQGVKVMVTGSNPGWLSRLMAWGYGETRF